MANLALPMTVCEIPKLPRTILNVIWKLRRNWVIDQEKEKRIAVLAKSFKSWESSKLLLTAMSVV